MCLVAQSCPTICDSMNCSAPGSSVLGGPPAKNIEVGINNDNTLLLFIQSQNDDELPMETGDHDNHVQGRRR